KSKKASSFHEFARSTSDAWDIGDDEDDDFLGGPTLPSLPPPPPPSGHISSKVAVTTTNPAPHFQGWGREKLKTDGYQSNGRVVKSQSEAQLSTATGHTGNGASSGVPRTNQTCVTLTRVEAASSCSPGEQCPSECKACLIHSRCSAHKEAEWLPPVGSWRNVLKGPPVRNTLQKQQSLPLRPIIPLIARISDQNASGAPPMTVREKSRLEKFRQLLASPNTDLALRGVVARRLALVFQLLRERSDLKQRHQLPLSSAAPQWRAEELRKHSWSGIPREVRPITWRLLSGYLPANMERRELVLRRKREEYFGFIQQYYDSRNDEHHRDTYRQGLGVWHSFGSLSADTCPTELHILNCKGVTVYLKKPLLLPRQVNPGAVLVSVRAAVLHFLWPHCNRTHAVFERILFIWAIRHPASGYVQGINDLVTPFFVVFLSEFVEEDVENFDVSALPLDTQRNIEADSFWCMSKLLDGIQDNYTFAQPGIQIKVKALEELVSRIDEDVHNHFRKYEVEYLQFAFRWMNNLLMRELPLRCTIRLWDTYQAEAEGFSHFHLYVCAAFLIKWRKEILSMVDFQGLLMLLQNLPTIHWGNEEVGLLLAEAYRLKYMFADAPNHYRR
ncbi:TB22B protein, partial [Atractosteus spatula]|nr:TB22B protein [Atractosteus spatula]